MKVLLIGGTGILSTDIVKLCVSKNYEVYIINRGHNNKNVDKSVKIIIGDINNKEEIKKKISDIFFDVVIDFLSFTEQDLQNKLDIFNNKCEQFIFISSATAYRKTKVGERITEDTELYNPEWDYSQGKILCEELLEKNYNSHKQKYTIVRPYVTYSERRIPFAIIPPRQWTLANRILNDKPILLWDNGKAICTLTQTKEFAVGIVGLFLNEKAYQEAFHITTDYSLTWKSALEDIGKALKKNVNIAGISSEYIIEKMPEYKGVLRGDKGLDREFDNSKIKSVVPEFNAKTKFEDGIKETIEYYRRNKEMQNVDYFWDGRVDRLIEQYYKKIKTKYDKRLLSIRAYKEKLTFKDKVRYCTGRNTILYTLFKIIRKLV